MYQSWPAELSSEYSNYPVVFTLLILGVLPWRHKKWLVTCCLVACKCDPRTTLQVTSPELPPKAWICDCYMFQHCSACPPWGPELCTHPKMDGKGCECVLRNISAFSELSQVLLLCQQLVLLPIVPRLYNKACSFWSHILAISTWLMWTSMHCHGDPS